MNHDSFVLISSETGIGKTTILNTVMEELGPGYVTAKLREKEGLATRLSAHFFLEKKRSGNHVIIIVDEAHNPSCPALEELRLLSCIDTSDRRIVSIILTGQPSLDDLRDAPGLTQLRQQARLRQRLAAIVDRTTERVLLGVDRSGVGALPHGAWRQAPAPFTQG